MKLSYINLYNCLIKAFRKAMFLKPIINTPGIDFIVSLRIIKAHMSLWLVFNPIVLRLIIFLVIFTIQSYFLPTVYAMEDDPTDPSKIIMDQRKVDNDLLLAISDERIASRIQAIAQGPYAHAFEQDLTRIQLGEPPLLPIVGALNEAIDNVNDDVPLRERIRGYESIIIFVSATILAYVIINHWQDIFSFMGRSAHNALTTLDPIILGERAFQMYMNPETRQNVEALVSHYYNNHLL